MVNNQKFEETFNQVNSQYANFFENKKVKVLEERKKALITMLIIIGGFFLCMIIPFLFIFLFMGIIGLIIYAIVNNTANHKNGNNLNNNVNKVSEEASYTTQYKQLVITPFIKLLTPYVPKVDPTKPIRIPPIPALVAIILSFLHLKNTDIMKGIYMNTTMALEVIETNIAVTSVVIK